MGLEPAAVTQWAALVVGLTFTLCTVLLVGFRRGRLRTYNIVVVFVIALVGFRFYAQLETGRFGGWWGGIVWIALAICGVWGLIGMLALAGKDPPVYGRGERPHQRPTVEEAD